MYGLFKLLWLTRQPFSSATIPSLLESRRPAR